MLFEIHSGLFVGAYMCIFLCLEFSLLSLLWNDVPYPLRPCSNATGSLKLFFF